MEMERSQHPRVAVIIPAFFTPETPADFDACFASLEAVEYPREQWMIILPENPSPHGSSATALAPWLAKSGITLPEIRHVLRAADGGYAGANLTGYEIAKASGAEFLFLLNQDSHVDPLFLSRAVAHAQAHPTAALVQSRIMLAQHPELLNSQGNALHYLGFGYCDGYRQTPTDAGRSRAPMFYPSGAAMLVRVAALQQIGFFDAGYYMYHEDVDLGWRARLAGFEIGYAEDSVVYHRYEFSRSIKKFFWMERNRLLTHLSLLHVRTLLLIWPLMKLMGIGMLVFALRGGWIRELWRAWMFFLTPSAWRWIRARRIQMRAIRRVPDREILAHMVGIIRHQETDSWLTLRVVNPILNWIFKILNRIVVW